MKHLFRVQPEDLAEHYPSRAEHWADFWVHMVGIVVFGVGALVLFVLALLNGGVSMAAATAIYAACLLGLLATSAIYNLRKPCPKRRLFRKLDEAAIFLLIAGSYTPFTTQRFEGGWALGMTAAVWIAAFAGVFAKLFLHRVPEWAWSLVYIAFGWLIVVALKPLIAGVSLVALILLAIGGILYTVGVPFFLWQSLPYRRAIWHTFVVAAAATHFAAVVTGVVLA